MSVYALFENDLVIFFFAKKMHTLDLLQHDYDYVIFCICNDIINIGIETHMNRSGRYIMLYNLYENFRSYFVRIRMKTRYMKILKMHYTTHTSEF